jgi:RNA polymerase sigma-70 factor (ECF subfamily)
MLGIAASLPEAASTDDELVERSLRGDRDAFGELALRYEAGLFRHLLRLTGSREDAEELAQEALLRAYRALPQYRRQCSFAPWLFCIATNLVRDAARRSGKRVFESADNLELVPDERLVSAPEQIERTRQFQRVEDALLQLPPVMQAILNLHYREGMKLAQIARVLGQDARTIRVAAHRARLRLRKMLLPGEGGTEHE